MTNFAMWTLTSCRHNFGSVQSISFAEMSRFFVRNPFLKCVVLKEEVSDRAVRLVLNVTYLSFCDKYL